MQKAVTEGDIAAQEEKSWELFAWLRKRENFGIRQQPAHVPMTALAIRGDALDFGEKLIIRKPKPAALASDAQNPHVNYTNTAVEQEGEPEQAAQDGGEPQNGQELAEATTDTVHSEESDTGGTPGDYASRESGWDAA